MSVIAPQMITGLVLSGGQGSRMAYAEKGLQNLSGIAMAQHVITRLRPQVGTVIINANQHTDQYQSMGFAVIPDMTQDFNGPLAGIQAGLHLCATPYLLCVPCDAPFLLTDLSLHLSDALSTSGADLAVSVTQETLDQVKVRVVQPVFCLLRKSLEANLTAFLQGGGRKVRAWQNQVCTVEVVFGDASAFRNINTLAELRCAEISISPHLST